MADITTIDGDFIRHGKDAYREGCKAAESGKPKSDNPYSREWESYLAHRWNVGYARTFYNLQFERAE